MFVELVLVLLLILANGVFAMSEIAVVTARRTRLEQRAEAGDASAAAAAALKDEPTAFLSAVQVGITLVGILAGAFGGARLAERLADPLASVSWIAPHQDTVAFIVVVGAITYLSLVLGELVPKRIALANPEGIAARVARPMQRLGTVARPLVALLTASTNGIARLVGVRGDADEQITEHDIRALIAQGARSGVVHETEEDILERVFYLGDRQVQAVMTPRPDIDWIDVRATREQIRDAAMEGGNRARFLVCEGTLDHVRGVVRSTELLAQVLGGTGDRAVDLSSILRQPHFVPVTMPLLQLLQQFRMSGVHLAVARGDDGTVQGIVTLNDLLSDLVAHVPGTVGTRETDIVRRDDGSWLIDGGVPLEELERALGTKVLPLAEQRGKQTLRQLVERQLRDVPEVGASFELGGYRFEIVDMDESRVDRVLVEESRGERAEGGGRRE